MTSTKSNIDTIIWDADGVLFSSFDEQGQFRWSRTIKEDLEIDATILADIFSPNWHDVLLGKRDTHTYIADVLAKNGSAIKAEDYITYWLEKDVHVNQEIIPYMSVAHACIGTNQDSLRSTLIANLFAPHIRRLFASSAIGHLKNEKQYYRFIEQELALAPRQLCLIDDTASNVEAARTFGWVGHHYTDIENLKKFLATHDLHVQRAVA